MLSLPHRIINLNTESPVEWLCGEVAELLRCGAFVEKALPGFSSLDF